MRYTINPDRSQIKSIVCKVYLTEDEATLIKEAAKIRNLSVAEYFRRTALGRKADVKYETEIVTMLGTLVKIFRDIHAILVETNRPMDEYEFNKAVNEAKCAMLRITK